MSEQRISENEVVSGLIRSLNVESKALGLLHLNNEPVGPRGLSNRVEGTVGDEELMPVGHMAWKNYCLGSFVPANLAEVVKEDIGSRVVSKYAIAPLGEVLGQPAAAFSLDYAVQNGISINQILGNSPVSRMELLELLSNGSTTRVDACKNLGMNHPSFDIHMADMEKMGLVSYDSVGSGQDQKGKFKYEWTGKDTSLLEGRHKGIPGPFMKSVLDAVVEGGQVDMAYVADKIGRDQGVVSTRIAPLMEKGFIRAIDWRRREHESNASITQQGNEFLTQYVGKLVGASRGGSDLGEMCGFLERLRENPREFHELAYASMENQLRDGGVMASKGYDVASEEILDYLVGNPGARLHQIGKDLDIKAPERYMRRMEKEGKVAVSRQEGKSVTKYFAV